MAGGAFVPLVVFPMQVLVEFVAMAEAHGTPRCGTFERQ